MIKLLIKPALLLALCFGLGAQAAPTMIDPRAAKLDVCGRYEMWHINGIMTNPTDAQRNLQRLRELYGNSFNEHLIVYGLAYNQTRGFAADVTQSAQQVIRQFVGATWDNFLNAVTFNIYDIAMPRPTARAISEAVTLIWGFNKVNPSKDADLAEITSAIVGAGYPSAKRILVGHSQGTLYMNEVYDRLLLTGANANQIGVVGVSVMGNTLRGGGVYTTSRNDMVADTVRLGTGGNVLRANVTVPVSDFLGHNLRDIYLNHPATANRIVAQIKGRFKALRSAVSGTFYPLPLMTYASTIYSDAIGSGVRPEGVPSRLAYWTVAPYDSTQFVVQENVTVADAEAVTRANGELCYNMAIALIKKQRAEGNYGWATMGYPNNYGCWNTIGGDPRTDGYGRMGALFLYSGDAPPVWRTWYAYQQNQVGAEGGLVCKAE